MPTKSISKNIEIKKKVKVEEFIKAVEEAEKKAGKEKVEFGKNYVMGYDLAAPENKDYSAVSMLCCNCNTIILSKVFEGEELSLLLPKKCPYCGTRFEKLLSQSIQEAAQGLSEALEEFRDELFKALKIPQIADWLNKQITKIS